MNIDVNEITGPMALKRDELLAEAEQAVAYAAQQRETARKNAEQALRDGEEAAQNYERTAEYKRAHANRWSQIIAREELEASRATEETAGDLTTVHLIEGDAL